jgi:hypothetical protein
MNDPHVEWLLYRFRTDHTLMITNAPAIDFESEHFRCHLDNDDLTVTMKEHHAGLPSARARVDAFLEEWEVNATLTRGRREFGFEYVDCRISDRAPSPPPGASQTITPMPAEMSFGVGTPQVIRGEHAYPAPPTGFTVSLDVRVLFARYQEYAKGREPLAGMAFACYLHITEALAKGEADAADKFNVSKNVFENLSRLAGGRGRRKDLTQEPYTPNEEKWVSTTVRILILRVGEYEAGGALTQITMAELPKLSSS